MSDAPETGPVWELLSSGRGPDLHFLDPDQVQTRLFDLLERAPARVLDVGCYCGGNGAYVKQRWPQAEVIGVEPLAEAAEIAAKRLDRVITGTFESIDFDSAGLPPGSSTWSSSQTCSSTCTTLGLHCNGYATS